jgi:hypothetical protein
MTVSSSGVRNAVSRSPAFHEQVVSEGYGEEHDTAVRPAGTARVMRLPRRLMDRPEILKWDQATECVIVPEYEPGVADAGIDTTIVGCQLVDWLVRLDLRPLKAVRAEDSETLSAAVG